MKWPFSAGKPKAPAPFVMFPSAVAVEMQQIVLRSLTWAAVATVLTYAVSVCLFMLDRWFWNLGETTNPFPLVIVVFFGMFFLAVPVLLLYRIYKARRRQNLEAGRVYGRLLSWVALVALLVFVAINLMDVVFYFPGPFKSLSAFYRAAFGLLIVVLVLIPLRMLYLSRPLQDTMFKGVGFGATFFGMGMLVLFLSQLAAEVYDWARYVPMVLEKRNQETLLAREELQNVDKRLKETKSKIQADMEAEIALEPDEASKQALRDIYNDRILIFAINKTGNVVLDPKTKSYTIEDNNIIDPLGRLVLTVTGKELLLVSNFIPKGTIVRDKEGVVYQFEEGFPVKDKDGKQVPIKVEKDAKAAQELKVQILGAASEAMANERLIIVERKAIADMPLRDPSLAGVIWHFLTHGPSDSPENAGIFTALLGSLFVAFITILFAVPIGVGAALYLEEYRQVGWLSRFIQININNLAGVPSVVYGILGGAVFVYMFSIIENDQARLLRQLAHDPNVAIGFWDRVLMLLPAVASRNVLGGGLTLALLTLPVVIVASQEAIRAVPQSIRHGAYALGATQWQTIWSNVLPMARPGILTGTILSLSRAIGEAAPLILFGALLFVDQNPSLFSRFTILPMQIFGWAERPADVIDGQRLDLWRYNAAVAIVVLLVVLLAMNAVAIVLRNRAQRQMRY